MSTPSEPTTTEAVDRSVAATRRICDELSLGTLKPKELKHLATALAEAAAEEAAHNTAFRECILAIYNELQATASPKKPSARSGASHSKMPPPWLIPIHPVDPKMFGPDKPLDPYLIQYVYGDEKLRLILDGYPSSELKKAVAAVEQRNPGTKPTNRTRKDALVEYIVRYVVG